MVACEGLPSDMVFEIVSRTSLETLEQCKEVSKGFNKMIEEEIFLPRDCVFGYFFQTPKNFSKYLTEMVYDADHSARSFGRWQRDAMQILASCDQGILVCCQEQRCFNNRYFACKPSTNQWQPLPNPKLRYQTDGVAIIVVKSQPLRYIIVRLSELIIKNICEIFDSKTWRWEKIQGPNLSGNDHLSNSPPVSVGRSTHWLTSNHVLTLDVKERRFRCLPLPAAWKHDAYEFNSKRLVKYEGGLGIITDDWKTTELWTEKQGEWTRKMVVDMKLLENTLCCSWSPRVVDFCSRDVMFVKTDGGGSFYYNVRDGKFRKVELPYDLKDSRLILRFRSDFQSVDLKQI